MGSPNHSCPRFYPSKRSPGTLHILLPGGPLRKQAVKVRLLHPLTNLSMLHPTDKLRFDPIKEMESAGGIRRDPLKAPSRSLFPMLGALHIHCLRAPLQKAHELFICCPHAERVGSHEGLSECSLSDVRNRSRDK